MDFVKILLFLIPFLVWYFCGYILNKRNVYLDNLNLMVVLGLVLSGISIYLTVSKLGIVMKIMYPFLLAVAFEGILMNDMYLGDRNHAFVVLMIMIFINSIRVYVQIKRGVLVGSVCLILSVLIITIKFINL